MFVNKNIDLVCGAISGRKFLIREGNDLTSNNYHFFLVRTLWGVSKNRGFFPPKWMVKVMEKNLLIHG